LLHAPAFDTTTTLSVAPSTTVGARTSLTLTAQVAHDTVTPTPTGTVTFFNGKTPLNRTPLVVNSSGVAMFNTSDLGGGAYSVTAIYSGDSYYRGSTSPVVALSVVDFKLIASPTTVTVGAAGGSGTTTLIVTPLGGFNETLTYTCAGLPAEATCTFAAGSAANLETLTIQTTADSARMYRSPFYKGRGSSFAMLVAGWLGLLILPVGSCYWGRRTARLLSVLALLGVSALWFPACGGGSTTPSTTSTNPGTPTGTSKVTVTSASSGKYALSHSATVTLTVK